MDSTIYTEYIKKYNTLSSVLQKDPSSIDFKEFGEIQQYIADYEKIEKLKKDIQDNSKIEDATLTTFISEENEKLQKEIEKIENKYKDINTDDTKDIILEIRPATGGVEASLFAEEMYNVYTKYAKNNGFEIKIMDLTYNSEGGIRSAIIHIEGNMAFEYFKYESGVHRVQRIPTTESSGRIHTSTISVVILPFIKNSQLDIKKEDLKIDYLRSSGPGGQHANKTESAVRITHIPTGISVFNQQTRSQIQNKETALQILRSRIYMDLQNKKDNDESEKRSNQIKGGIRSEKIRTYNFPQDRITDHRLGKNSNFHILDIMSKANILDIVNKIKEDENKGDTQNK